MRETYINQIWSEGYAATGQASDATFHGEFEGETFRDAVAAFQKSLSSKYSRQCVDLNNLTFWGCSFFDNEEDARKSFG